MRTNLKTIVVICTQFLYNKDIKDGFYELISECVPSQRLLQQRSNMRYVYWKI